MQNRLCNCFTVGLRIFLFLCDAYKALGQQRSHLDRGNGSGLVEYFVLLGRDYTSFVLGEKHPNSAAQAMTKERKCKQV